MTVISHDSENRTQVKGCEDAGCYSRNINYTGASLFQLKSLTAVSLHCEQFVKYECYHSRMEGFAWWVSRDSMNMTYWGGAKPCGNRLRCACRVKKTCTRAGYRCNCDANDRQWREDRSASQAAKVWRYTSKLRASLPYLRKAEVLWNCLTALIRF